MFKYSSVESQKELHTLLISIVNDGSYLELILDKDTDNLLKINILKTFWSQFDTNNGTNYCDDVIKNFEKHMQKQREAKMNQEKLASIDTIDWTL